MNPIMSPAGESPAVADREEGRTAGRAGSPTQPNDAARRGDELGCVVTRRVLAEFEEWLLRCALRPAAARFAARAIQTIGRGWA